MTYRGLSADYDAWKTRSDRDDGPDDEFEPEPEDEEDMEEPADIAALVERLRGWSGRATPISSTDIYAMTQEAADALEACQAIASEPDTDCESCLYLSKRNGELTRDVSRLLKLNHTIRRAALEEAAQICEGSFDSEMRAYGGYFATAIRALNERNPT